MFCKLLKRLDSFDGFEESALRTIPEEVLCIVIEYLPFDSIIPLSQTCRRINLAVKYFISITNTFNFENFVELTAPKLRKLVLLNPHVERLVLGGTPNISDDAFAHFIGLCSNIKEIELLPNSGVTDHGLQMAAKECPFLEKLVLHNMTDIGVIKLLRHVPQLKILHLVSCACFSSAMLEIAKSCPNLEELSIEYVKHFTDGVENILQQCVYLSRLRLRSFMLCEDSFGVDQLFPLCSRIRELDVSHNPKLGLCALLIAQHCHSLRHLNLSFCGLSTELLLRFLNHNMTKQLEYLNIAYNHITVSVLYKIRKQCPNLRVLEIQGTNLSSHALLTISEPSLSLLSSSSSTKTIKTMYNNNNNNIQQYCQYYNRYQYINHFTDNNNNNNNNRHLYDEKQGDNSLFLSFCNGPSNENDVLINEPQDQNEQSETDNSAVFPHLEAISLRHCTNFTSNDLQIFIERIIKSQQQQQQIYQNQFQNYNINNNNVESQTSHSKLRFVDIRNTNVNLSSKTFPNVSFFKGKHRANNIHRIHLTSLIGMNTISDD